ncbi:MAG: class II aldolase/adducin family protein [Sandaracinaceae bacterium]|nr:class II aldolase/adducin family protein [Sandaracinaceae bacterium]
MNVEVSKPTPNTMSAAEKQARIDLAACYRLVAHYGWDDMIFTHISARIPGAEHHFLINPFGMLFSEITASSLIKVDHDANMIEPSSYFVNPAGFTIHSAVHMAHPTAGCVLHLHTRAGIAVSAQKEGLQPLSQMALVFHDRVAYHDYEGIALDLSERERLVKDLGDKRALILRNHGTLTWGATVAEAFQRMYWLERACDAQIAAQAGGTPLHLPSQQSRETAAMQGELIWTGAAGLAWPALLRMLDKKDPSYRT